MSALLAPAACSRTGVRSAGLLTRALTSPRCRRLARCGGFVAPCRWEGFFFASAGLSLARGFRWRGAFAGAGLSLARGFGFAGGSPGGVLFRWRGGFACAGLCFAGDSRCRGLVAPWRWEGFFPASRGFRFAGVSLRGALRRGFASREGFGALLFWVEAMSKRDKARGRRRDTRRDGRAPAPKKKIYKRSRNQTIAMWSMIACLAVAAAVVVTLIFSG